MIDLHFHCLPGIDDGPEDWAEAVELCRFAASEGTRAIVATPHVLRGRWANPDPQVRDALVFRLNSMLGGTPSVLAGCEYFLSSDAVELVELGRRGPLTPLNWGRYLLVEFPSSEVLPGTGSIFHELLVLGVTPVVAHPERNRLFMEDPRRLEVLVERGAVSQLTAGSLLGDFGGAALAASEEFLRLGLVHLIASDAHSLDLRPPRLAAARAFVAREYGKAVELGIFESNPRAVLESKPLPWNSPGSDLRRRAEEREQFFP